MIIKQSQVVVRGRKQNTVYAFSRIQYTYIIRNVKVMMIIKSVYWSAWQQLREITSKHWRNKTHWYRRSEQIKRWREIHEELITQEHQDYEQILLTVLGRRLWNMIEKNGFDCTYIEIFTHRFGSIGAPSRRTVFIRGTDTQLWEVLNIASRNTKT
jgi:hypothetical protein